MDLICVLNACYSPSDVGVFVLFFYSGVGLFFPLRLALNVEVYTWSYSPIRPSDIKCCDAANIMGALDMIENVLYKFVEAHCTSSIDVAVLVLTSQITFFTVFSSGKRAVKILQLKCSKIN